MIVSTFCVAAFAVFQVYAQVQDEPPPTPEPPPSPAEDWDRHGLPKVNAPCKVYDLPEGLVQQEDPFSSGCKAYVSTSGGGSAYKYYEGNEARTCCLKVKCKPPYEKHYCRNTYKVVRNYLDLYDLGATGVWVMNFEHAVCPEEFGDDVGCWVPNVKGQPEKHEPLKIDWKKQIQEFQPYINPFGPTFRHKDEKESLLPAGTEASDPGNNAESTVAQGPGQIPDGTEIEGDLDQGNNAGLTAAQASIPSSEESNHLPTPDEVASDGENDFSTQEDDSTQGIPYQESPAKARSLEFPLKFPLKNSDPILRVRGRGRNAVLTERSRKLRMRFGQ